MKKIVFIALGGFIGAMLRYAIKNIPISGEFSITTLFINTAGCFILAFVSTLSLSDKKANMKLGITTGFCGAFTTFSTLCKESVLLITKGSYQNAALYLLLLITLGLFAVYTGVTFANTINNRREERICEYNNTPAEEEVK